MAGRVRRPIVGALLLVAAVTGSGPVAARPGADMLLRDQHGTVLARISLPEGSRITLRYRNSLYGSVAEERFVVQKHALRLVELAADERAVLDEYYVVDHPVERTEPGDARAWRGTPRDALGLQRLAVAATDLGKRTLIVPGRSPIDLWRLVDDRQPTVFIALQPSG